MAHTSGELQARLMWVFCPGLVLYVARPVELVCWDHREVPKSPICGHGRGEQGAHAKVT